MKKMTIITNRYTLGLILVALFSAMLYIGYMELKPYDEALVLETATKQKDDQFEWLNEDYVNLSKSSDDAVFFVEYRLDRDKIRGKQLELLKKIVEDPNSVAETRQEAQQKIIQITNYLEQELQFENLIKAKGFKDAVIFIQPQSVTAVVNQKEFTKDEIAQITDLVITVTGQSIENIYIVPNGGEKQ
ncbi:MAG: SpoIIIAH-like family protein [Clostridia bacterium]|nr:SpoIIIAH-like family protein [Clostridia bacterium]